MFSWLFPVKSSLDKFLQDKTIIVKGKESKMKFTDFKSLYANYCKIRSLTPVEDIKSQLPIKGFPIAKIGNTNMVYGIRTHETIECSKVELLKIVSTSNGSLVLSEIQSSPKIYRVEGSSISQNYDFKNKAMSAMFEIIDKTYTKQFKSWDADPVRHLFQTTNDVNDLIKTAKDFGISFHRLGRYPRKIFVLNNSIVNLFKSIGAFEEVKQTRNRSGKENICFKDLQTEFKDLVQQFKIPNTNYDVDYYSPSSKIAIEFLGDYYHGNLELYKDSQMNQTVGKTFGQLNQETFERIKVIRAQGVSVLYIWENDWDQHIKGSKTLKQILKS
jgi:hypothetical protein